MPALPPVPVIEFILSSRGMSKGLAQTDGPQALVRGELAFGQLYIGGYAKNVDSATSDGEAGAVVGVRRKAAGFDLGLSASWKRALDSAPESDRDALEVQASVSRKVGRLAPRISLTWSPDDLGSTRRSLFAEAGAAYSLSRELSASAAVARRARTGAKDYTAWNAGVAWTVAKPLIVDIRYYDTNGGDSLAYRARVVISGRVRF